MTPSHLLLCCHLLLLFPCSLSLSLSLLWCVGTSQGFLNNGTYVIYSLTPIRVTCSPFCPLLSLLQICLIIFIYIYILLKKKNLCTYMHPLYQCYILQSIYTILYNNSHSHVRLLQTLLLDSVIFHSLILYVQMILFFYYYIYTIVFGI